MAARRSIRNRRTRRKISHVFDLNLTSMMDVLTIILVFLLKTYSTANHQFSSVEGIKLPLSQSPDQPDMSLQVIVTPEGLTFEDGRVVDFVQNAGDLETQEANYAFKQQDLDEGGRRIRPLYDALVKAREKSELFKAQSGVRDAAGNAIPFDGILAIQADKRVKYETIRKVMYTAATAGYRVFRFLALAQEG